MIGVLLTGLLLIQCQSGYSDCRAPSLPPLPRADSLALPLPNGGYEITHPGRELSDPPVWIQPLPNGGFTIRQQQPLFAPSYPNPYTIPPH